MSVQILGIYKYSVSFSTRFPPTRQNMCIYTRKLYNKVNLLARAMSVGSLNGIITDKCVTTN